MESFMINVIAFVAGVKDRFTSSEKGATAVEYGMLVALIAAVIIATVALLGPEVQAGFQTVVDNL